MKKVKEIMLLLKEYATVPLKDGETDDHDHSATTSP